MTACRPRSVHGLRQAAVRSLSVCILLLAAGCARFQEAPEPLPEIVAPEAVPVSDEPLEQRTDPEPEPEAAAPRPEPEPLVAEPARGRIAIVLSDRSPAYENVAIELGQLLDDFLLYNLADKSLSPEATFRGIADSDAEAVIAIGLEAAERAMSLSTVPVVFCQVFNIDVTESEVPIRGISSIPPLAPQLEAWKSLNPDLRHVGAIIGEGHADLIEEARTATAENGVKLHYRTATSDRETLYLFNRMAPDIDGFWLFPDNRVLSITVLREMLSYARRHGVQIAVFNAGLLEMGAALSATAIDSDIAVTALEVTDRLINGDVETIPARTSLHGVDVRSVTGASSGAAAKGAR